MKKFKVTKGNGEPVIMEETEIYPMIEQRSSAFAGMLKGLKVGEGVYSNDTMTNFERVE